MLRVPPSASIAFLALIMPLTVMKKAANYKMLEVFSFCHRILWGGELTIMYAVMMANITIAKVYIFLLPWGLLPIESKKHITRRPRYV